MREKEVGKLHKESSFKESGSKEEKRKGIVVERKCWSKFFFFFFSLSFFWMIYKMFHANGE